MKKYLIWCLSVIITANMFMAGCSKSAASSEVSDTTVSTSVSSESSEKSEENIQYGSVTAVDGNTVTVDLGTLNSTNNMPNGTPPSKPGDSSKNEDGNDNTPPSKPGDSSENEDGNNNTPPSKPGDSSESEDSNDKTPPSKPNNDEENSSDSADNENSGKPDDMQSPPGNGSAPSMLELTGETLTFTVTDSTTITLESANELGSVSDITVGATISFTLADDGTSAEAVTVKSMNNGFGGGNSSGSDTGDITLSGKLTIDGETSSSDGESITSSDENQNAVLVTNSGSLTLSNATVTKSGDTTSDDESNFYGVNAIVCAAGGSTIAINGTSVLTSSSEGSNAIFATGEDSEINISGAEIHTTGNSARGLDATYGGKITASDMKITTEGAHCAAVATDRGEGTITISDSSLSCSGDGSPCIYSTGNITANNVTGTATGSQICVIEGKNSITLNNCTLTGAGKNGIMLYQSTSGDAAEGTSILTSNDSKLITTSEGEMFYITNTDAVINLKNTVLSFTSEILLNASGNNTNNWGEEGSNGGDVTLNASNQILEGDITCDSISTAAIVLSSGSSLTGAIDTADTGNVTISLDDTSIWNVTGNSYITVITDSLSDLSNIKSNGYTVYYDSSNSANEWLNCETITLSGGGKLMPMQS